MAEVTITAENFEEEVLRSDIPVLLDFWAPWCGPCRMLAPIIEEIAAEQEGKVKVGKINTDEQMQLAKDHGIMGIPTMIVYKGGQPAGQLVGFNPKEAIENLFK